jgi:putative flippase GtrA
MALSQNRLVTGLWARLRSKVGVRFTRFVVVAGCALLSTEITLTVCNGLFHMTSTPAALVSVFVGAVVSYILSRWAWERKGRPDVLRETVPFWVITALVTVILTLANKFAYHAASWMNLHHAKQVLFVDFVWLVANFCTFAMRFLIFHYVLFADRTTAARAAATGPDTVPPGQPGKVTPAAAPATVGTAEAGGARPGSSAASQPRGAANGAAAPAAPAAPRRSAALPPKDASRPE